MLKQMMRLCVWWYTRSMRSQTSRLLFLLIILAITVVIAGVWWQFYYTADSVTSQSMLNTSNNADRSAAQTITIDGTAYVVRIPQAEKKEVTATGVLPVVVEVTTPSSIDTVQGTKTDTEDLKKIVTTSSIDDIYINFPFLKEPNLTPEAALLHATLITTLQGDDLSVIENTPNQTAIDGWHKQYEMNKTTDHKAWLEGPNQGAPNSDNASGDVDWAARRAPDFSQVIAPKQENGLLRYYVLFTKLPHPLPVRASYAVGVGLSFHHDW